MCLMIDACDYSPRDSAGQEMLHRINGRNLHEIYVASEQLRSGNEDLQVLVSSERVLVFSRMKDSKDSKLVLSISHGDLVCARAISMPSLPSLAAEGAGQATDAEPEATRSHAGSYWQLGPGLRREVVSAGAGVV